MSSLHTAHYGSPNRKLLLRPEWVYLLAIFAVAVALGLTVGRENWLALAAAAAVALVLVRPVPIALGAFALLCPFDEIAVLGEGKSGTTINWFVGAGAAVILVMAGFMGRRWKRPQQSALWWSAFVLWGVVTAVWALDQRIVFERFLTSSALLVLYLAAVSVRVSKKEFIWIAALAILGGVIASSYTVLAFYRGTYYEGRASLITAGREADPNQFALSLIVPISLAVAGFLASGRRLAKIAAAIALVIMTLALLLTMSRGALVALAAVAICYVSKLKLNWRIVVPIALLLTLLLAMPQNFFLRVERGAQTGGAGRVDIWLASVNALKQYGLLGAGLSNFPRVYDNYAGDAPKVMGFSRAPHNIYLGMWVELGIVGLLFFLNAIRLQFRAANQCGYATPLSYLAVLAPQAGCWGLLAGGFFLDIVWRKVFWLGWILLAISAQTWCRSPMREEP
jgi:O-antigen ligase